MKTVVIEVSGNEKDNKSTGNRIGVHGAEVISQALKENSLLEILNLSSGNNCR